ncbi:protein singed wings 2-like isoform X1 [Vespa mandarinia]|uniref:protein singed wings 2-like isoform X1 n=1 Tax=Vespa mandarinia TaxID=7446 RepID=UPI001621107C|nr:protein singed wings 2-like isoform X1 [Vespa mandarinia]XP_035724178.1 protein singed wings 2-like isoform X1 [Vespa mandarinia]
MWLIIILMITFESRMMFSRASAKDNETLDCHRINLNIELSECHLKVIGHRLTCFAGIDDKWKTENETVENLVLCNWPNTTFDPQEVLQGFPLLRKFKIANSNLTRLMTPFPEDCQFLEKVNLTHNKLELLPVDVFANLSNLRIVDLRYNYLKEIDLKGFNVPTLSQVYLFGNPLKCTENISWILDLRNGSFAEKIVDREKLRCSVPYNGRPLVPVVEIIMTLKDECKRTLCDCELVYVVGRGGKRTLKQLMAFTSVNCSYRNLNELPEFLPANTTTLHLNGNKIKDLTPLVKNPVYKQVLDLYLDDNLVESIVQLDGSYWLDHFRLFSLRGNKLSDVPTYALENVLLQSGSVARLYLGNNPWRCDCLFTPGFQDLLIRYTNLVRDINEVKCAAVRGDENSNKQIRDLTRTEICISSDENSLIYPLDILNIILAFLIFLIIGKLLYDYWSFKKTGKLPWIVSKIP